MKIALALYDKFTALDIIGPYQVLAALPGAEAFFVAEKRGIVSDDSGAVRLEATRSFAEVREADIVVVGGGPFTHTLIPNHPIIPWLRDMHGRTQWTTSVCTGSLLLGAAGILRGRKATTHWLSLDLMAEFGAEPSSERVVEQGKVVTAAGVSSGIDMALLLAQRIAGDDVAQAIQLSIEYDPQPPFDAGSPAKAPKHVVDLVTAAAAKLERQPGSSGRPG
jgi:putative intracellular protease/amidase